MADIHLALQNLGLNDKEASIYLALLELGRGTIQEIAQKSKVKRTNVYNFIGPLKEKGVISEVVEDETIILIPENPSVLLKRAQDNYQNVKNVLPELMGIFNTPSNKPKVRFFEGEDGIKKGYDDILESGETVYGFSDYEKMLSTLNEEWWWNFPERRKDKNIFFYCIAKAGPRGKEVKNKDKTQLRETKLFKNLQLDTEINIYGNKVMMVSFRRPYAVVLIEDRAIAMSMKSIWQGWWDGLKK